MIKFFIFLGILVLIFYKNNKKSKNWYQFYIFYFGVKKNSNLQIKE